ncbi:MAG: putative lipid II flippase FtsW [Bacteroidales bacterium]|nr:putative lipid II flippase FtsW [Bacteroidales bacterium]
MSTIFKYIKGDKVIWIVVIILSIFSVLAVYSSTGTLAYKKQAGNTEYYLLKHATILILGFVLMYFTHRIKYTYISRISQIALYIAILLLAYTLFKGTNLNEAKRWLTLPIINLTFQSSDFAKLVLKIYIARLLSIKQKKIKDFKSAFVPIMLPILIICVLILPANFSTAAILFTTSLIIMFVGRVNLKYIFYLIGISIVSLAIFILILMSFPNNRVGVWGDRLENFYNGGSEENYQVEQAKIAIATGGIFGKKPGRSTQRNFLPSPYSDFIYAIIIEEYGLLGGIIVILLYMILLYRGVRIVIKTPGDFGAFMAIGITFSLVFQAMINMAVAVNLFPVTGQTLPFISMGGTSLWFSSISIGIVLSVSRGIEESKKEKQNATA